jgi:hypothetical protein
MVVKSFSDSSAIAPATMAEISFGVDNGRIEGREVLDRYSISLVEGYNLQLQIRPVEGAHTKETNKRFDCNLAGCFKDINSICPEYLALRSRRSGVIVGCQNPCLQSKSYFNETSVSVEYQSCLSQDISFNFYSMVQVSCPDVLVFDKHVCEGVVYTCKKNQDNVSAYEVIFCP